MRHLVRRAFPSLRRLLSATATSDPSSAPVGLITLQRMQDLSQDLLLHKCIATGEGDHKHPLLLNLDAMASYYAGDVAGAAEKQERVVKIFEASVGLTSDNFVDIAGSLNDLACIRMGQATPNSSSDRAYVLSEKGLKRALRMCERAYKINRELQVCLWANLCEVYRRQGRAEEALSSATHVISLYSHQYRNKKQGPSSTLSPSSAPDAAPDPLAPITSHLWPAYRSIQVKLMVARCVALVSVPEEGLIWYNTALQELTADVTLPLDLKRVILVTALVDLRQVRRS